MKTVTKEISQDENTALNMNLNYTTKMFELRLTRQILHIVPGILLLVAFISSLVLDYRRQKATPLSQPKLRADRAPPPLGVTPTPEEGTTFTVGPGGAQTTTINSPPNTGEHIGTHEFIDTSELGNTTSPSRLRADFLTNEKINRLIEQGKIPIEQAGNIRRQTSNMDFLESERFLSAIEHRADTGRQAHERSFDSILKRYGIDPPSFKKR